MTKVKRIRNLTPHEEVKIEEQAYNAYLERQKLYDPPPAPSVVDLVHENKTVTKVLTDAVSWLPAVLAVVGIASIVVSLDKTAAAFHASVANADALGGAWAVIVALFGVVMADAALVVSEFALARDMLKKDLHRRVWTLKGLWYSIQVRLGNVPPLDYGDMPDSNLRTYSRFVFGLVLAANVYSVINVAEVNSLHDITFTTALFLFVGVTGALSLRFIGQQMAHIVYELMTERRKQDQIDMYNQWAQDQADRWDQMKEEILNQAKHNAFIVKNNLPLEAGSPYLLMSGEGDKLEITPFVNASQTSFDPHWRNTNNGNRHQQ